MGSSSGIVSWLTSMTGGWYVWIMDMGRALFRELFRLRRVGASMFIGAP